MEAKELRTGNFVTVIDIDTKENITLAADWGTIRWAHHHNPIPLTEEWFLKFGFDMHKFKSLDIIYGTMYASNNTENGGLEISLAIGRHVEESDTLPHIKYVHQLQNLYFALTGEELAYSPNK
jgi:hypothetical protein